MPTECMDVIKRVSEGGVWRGCLEGVSEKS